jgi:hypothetical protein
MLVVFCCFLHAAPCSASVGEAKFGTGVTNDWKLIGEATEFDTNLITCAFFCTKPAGVMTVAVSIYFQDPASNSERLLARVNIDVNPDWGIFVLTDIPLPETGKYTFSLSTPEGEMLSKCQVTITEKKVEKEMPEQPKIDGTTLESLFHKFMPKN